VAIASAKVAYRIFKEVFTSAIFSHLAQRGGRVQRLLWASTSTKNPAYSDVKYVEPLIGPETINTLPMETLRAYRDHGKPAISLGSGVARAERVLKSLSDLGINLDQVTQSLEDEGVEKFVKPYDLLLTRLSEKRTAFLKAVRKTA
jgi:transaldolase